MEYIISFSIANESLTDFEQRDIKVIQSDINKYTDIVTYKILIPKYLFFGVADKAPWYMRNGVKPEKMDFMEKINMSSDDPRLRKYPKFTRWITKNSIRELRDELKSISDYAISMHRFDIEPDEKVICIKFNSATSSKKTQYNFADAGKNTSIGFQYFIAYRKPNPDNSLFPGVKNYYSRVRKNSQFSTAPSYKQQYSNFEANRIWYHHTPNRPQGFENEFTIIEWTPEREAFFSKVQSSFINLADELSKYLGNLDETKIELLLQNFTNLLLLPSK